MNYLNTINGPQIDLFSREYTDTITSKVSLEIDIEKDRWGSRVWWWAQAYLGWCSLGITTIYGGQNFNGAEKQLRLANGNVKDKFRSVGREQIPAYPKEREASFLIPEEQQDHHLTPD